MNLLKNKLLLYSTQSSLAHYINKNFYDDVHYVWCSPVFNPAILERSNAWSKIGATSAPCQIFKDYQRDIKKKDRHSRVINENKNGLLKGANFKLKEAIINETNFKEIGDIVNEADISEFEPIVYLIDYKTVKDRVERVEVTQRANPLGVEFIIKDLKSSEFELIDFNLY